MNKALLDPAMARSRKPFTVRQAKYSVLPDVTILAKVLSEPGVNRLGRHWKGNRWIAH